jgi:hypothetical protein
MGKTVTQPWPRRALATLRRGAGPWLTGALLVLLPGWPAATAQASDLNPTEARWLKGIAPVVAYARALKWPLDLVVQPQDTPGLPPLAVAFVDGRCKLVMSMRGNPSAQRTLDRIEPELLDPALELMAAHELGHCRRYLDGVWFGLPAGFVSTLPTSLSDDSRSALTAMLAVRREEGYGDLVGLAWTQQRHPQLYARLQVWLLGERSRDVIAGSHHDTRAWVRLAQDGNALTDASIFNAATPLWRAGLLLDAGS